jgi:DNA-directed RNA polymerase subunit RPC12/RpoP
VIELKRKAPKPSYITITCPECNGETWKMRGLDAPELAHIMGTVYECTGCGCEVEAITVWPEVDE